jgi:N6-L-threonylcarbamoyladenine synthase
MMSSLIPQAVRRIFSSGCPSKTTGLILGIESTCDESACALMDFSGNVISHEIASQIDLTKSFGGVFPIEAARAHRVNLPVLLDRVLPKAHDLRAIAIAIGPGLAPCLQVGVAASKKLALERKLDLVAVNHLEAHVLVAMLEHPQLKFPFSALLLSGGHSLLLGVNGIGDYVIDAETRDDAVGEAYDKLAVLLGIETQAGESFGAAVERRARLGDPKDQESLLPLPMASVKDLAFSFSGLKSSARRRIQLMQMNTGSLSETQINNLCAAFQERVTQHLEKKLVTWNAQGFASKNLVLCGGVANNTMLFKRIHKLCSSLQIELIRPSPELCGDNGIMIAYAGLHKYLLGHVVKDIESLTHNERWPLGPTRSDFFTE